MWWSWAIFYVYMFNIKETKRPTVLRYIVKFELEVAGLAVQL